MFQNSSYKMKNLINRSLRALNIQQFNNINKPLKIGGLEVTPPEERQYILRMLIKRPFEDISIPKELEWVKPIVYEAFESQKKLGIIQPFCYLTIRHGLVTTSNDDVWHVDGFSTTITHLPEQNYIWCSHTPTEYVVKKIKFPSDFDPQKHNIHLFLQDNINESDKIYKAKPKTLYCFDVYVPHRRPKLTKDTNRTFVRVSFTPIEINDCNNTFNSLLPTNYKRDGVKDFRNKLIKYDANK